MSIYIKKYNDDKSRYFSKNKKKIVSNDIKVITTHGKGSD